MIRVMIVDDSAVVRQLYRKALKSATDIQIIAEAPDPYRARELLAKDRPDVLLLDVEMPRMDGITFLRKLSQHLPLPVVICSSLTEAGGRLALEAFDAGAVDVICKPQNPSGVAELGVELARALRAAAAARHTKSATKGALLELSTQSSVEAIAIGASTGGTSAVEAIVSRLPAQVPPIVIVQHMPAYITSAFAARLNTLCRLRVEEATPGRALERGLALVAPGDRHLEIVRVGRELRCRLTQEPRVNGHRPAVDVMFHSLASVTSGNAIGMLLTGMGKDGALGLLALRQSGAHTLAQDEKSSVVYGMPRSAVELDAACEVVGLEHMAQRLVRALERSRPLEPRSRSERATE